MTNFLKGGRGVKAPYESITKRIPLPIVEIVDDLVEEYRSTLEVSENTNLSESQKLVLDELKQIISSVELNEPGYKSKSATRLIKKLLELKEHLQNS